MTKLLMSLAQYHNVLSKFDQQQLVMVNYACIFNQLESFALEERRKFQALVLVYKCIHNEAPRYIEDFLRSKSVIII